MHGCKYSLLYICIYVYILAITKIEYSQVELGGGILGKREKKIIIINKLFGKLRRRRWGIWKM